MNKDIVEQNFGGRIRVCALCFLGEKILVIKHSGLGADYLLAPPGGGVNLFETAEDALKRELKEETNLDLISAQLCLVSEFVKPPLHAIELFYLVDFEGELKKGFDPEISEQIIEKAYFCEYSEILKEKVENRHSIFNHFQSVAAIKQNKVTFLSSGQ